MVSELGNSNSGTQRTRRNTMKMGAILAFAALGSVSKTDPASANCGNNGKLVGNGCEKGNATNCFLKGTKIQTAEGERKVEDLAIGDLLPTMFGGLRPVQWIGRYPIRRSDPTKPWVKDALPVRIARSALAPNVPHADLYVTRGHSLLIDGVLVPAEVLINGTTITRYEGVTTRLAPRRTLSWTKRERKISKAATRLSCGEAKQ
jgi:hypothetical protein